MRRSRREAGLGHGGERPEGLKHRGASIRGQGRSYKAGGFRRSHLKVRRSRREAGLGHAGEQPDTLHGLEDLLDHLLDGAAIGLDYQICDFPIQRVTDRHQTFQGLAWILGLQ